MEEPTSQAADDGLNAPPPRPRWVKVSAIVVIVLVALIAVLLLVGPGGHSPGSHSSGGDTADRQSKSAEPSGAGGHQPPAGMDHGLPQP